MCMIDDAERYDAAFDRWHTARKPHRCCECRREIQPGEKYTVGGGRYEGEWVTHKTCRQCAAVREWLHQVCSGWVYENVEDDLREHFQQGYGIWLGRAVIGIRRKWQRRDGSLMPPMPLPENINEIRA